MRYFVVFLISAVCILGVDLLVPRIEPAHAEMGQIDDAYISYRYVKNLLRGEGLVYNKGERVEGFSNMLWVLLLALTTYALNIDVTHSAHLLAILCSAVSLTAVYGLSYHISKNRWVSIFPVLLVGLTIHFNTWALSGLETPLWLALIVSGMWAAMSKKMILASILAGLCFWTRPDGGLLGVAILLPHLWKMWEPPSSLKELPAKNWREKWPPVVIWISMVGVLTIFRLMYYGSPVPNAAVAKIGGIPVVRGLEYVLTTLREGGWVFLFPSVFLLYHKNGEIILFVTLQTVYTVVIGGDAFLYGRFLTPVMALLSCSWGYAYIVLKDKREGLLAFKTLYGYMLPMFSLLYLCAVYCPYFNDRKLAHVKNTYKYFEYGTRKMSTNYEGDETVACIGIGSFGYYNMDVRILDMVGLVTPEVSNNRCRKGENITLMPGHHRSNPEWILSQNPDEIHLPSFLNLPCVVEMKELSEFQQKYRKDESRRSIWVKK